MRQATFCRDFSPISVLLIDIRIKLFGEEHPHTAECFFSLGETQYALRNFSSALQSKQRALDIRVKLFGEEHPHKISLKVWSHRGEQN